MNTITKRREAWVSDQGDGTYINPVLHADYSDPDVIRVGDDFYMTASSFGHIPGLPLLHSKDLVNWRLINHIIPHMPLEGYDKPQHGNGVWAPSIRYHDGKFWVFYGDPDVGIFMTTAEDPAGEWAPLHLVKDGKGLIDTCPFWDDDGNAYLVHAFARSRCGIKHLLRLCRMSPDGRSLLDEGQIIFDGTEHHPTIEGPKMYKRNGYYYIFAPAGGVRAGWQTILRSRSIYGPYEDKIVLHQGDSPINGPHQGGWVELESGESWFMHFQDKGAYGRIVHLQPVRWVDDWPLMGEDTNGDGIGEPVLRWKKPDVGAVYPIETPVTSDEFDGEKLGLQWQWQANPRPEWAALAARPGWLSLHAEPAAQETGCLYLQPNLLLQKFPALEFAATAKIDASALQAGDRGGLIVFGYQYRYIGVAKDDQGKLTLLLAEGDKEQEVVLAREELNTADLLLRVCVYDGARCDFSFSLDGEQFTEVGQDLFQAREGHWVGAKVGLFAVSSSDGGGTLDADWFRVTALE